MLQYVNYSTLSRLALLWLIIMLMGGCSNAAPATTTTSVSPTSVPSASARLVPELALNGDGYLDISVDQLAQLLPQKNFTLVNVHIPYEGELPQTDQLIAFNEITDHLDKLPAKDAAIVLYCRSGGMSTAAAKELVGLGYTNVYELDGGFDTWASAGKELLHKPQ